MDKGRVTRTTAFLLADDRCGAAVTCKKKCGGGPLEADGRLKDGGERLFGRRVERVDSAEPGDVAWLFSATISANLHFFRCCGAHASKISVNQKKMIIYTVKYQVSKLWDERAGPPPFNHVENK
jgi:hypothetical protein